MPLEESEAEEEETKGEEIKVDSNRHLPHTA
jgi:hypothetical protein